MKIREYTKPVSANAYAKDIAELISLGEGKSGAITVASDGTKLNSKGESVSDNSLANAQRAFQNAARDAGKTARLVGKDVNDDNTTDLWFILVPLIERKGTGSDGTETATDAEYTDTASDVASEDVPEPTTGKRNR